MPRQKSPKADNLTNAMATLSTAVDDLVKATNRLNAAFDKKDHKEATAALAEVHLQVLHCKDSSNHTYSHLSELRPKTEPKPPRKEKGKDMKPGDYTATMGPKGVITDVKKVHPKTEPKPPRKDKADVKTNRRDMSKAERRSRTFDDAIHRKTDEQAADEPSDPDSV